MTALQELPDLEQTLIEIIVELLLVDKENRYPDLIFGDLDHPRAIRASMHYVMALLAYGFQPGHAELAPATEWFNRPFPSRHPHYIDPVEMNRLAVTLHLQPQHPYVRARLVQLGEQRGPHDYDIQSGWPYFDTLWALDTFALAQRQGVLTDEMVTLDELRRRLHFLIISGGLYRDKDISLALRLQHALFGGLEPEHEKSLRELIEVNQQNGFMWGLREFGWQKDDMPWYHVYKSGRPLSHEAVRSHQEKFRKVVVSTCMTLEHLLPLLPDYPELQASIECSMRLWWDQFRGKNAVSALRVLFPRPLDYEYLLVLARTLRAVQAYIGRPPLRRDTLHLLRELTSIRTNLSESQETRSIKQALRSWIQIELLGNIEPLKLGFSEAQIVRVRPEIRNPLLSDDGNAVQVVPHSVIIKYGPPHLIESERTHYEALPGTLRDMFVRIPDVTYTDPETGNSFVIMQDLRDYVTLYEINEPVAQHVAEVGDPLGAFLMRMHEGGTSQWRPVPKSLVREMYLAKMLENIDRIFDFVCDNQFFRDEKFIKSIQYELFDRIGDIMLRQRRFEAFPAAYMHGDLHMRNIMVHGFDKGRLRHTGAVFKLIDLEYLQRDGDAAFDAGQLLVDIDLVCREERSNDSDRRLQALAHHLEKVYIEFGEKRKDPTFEVRLKLAKARALLRIGKGKSKRAERLVRTSQASQAEQMAEEMVMHASEALEHLQGVVAALR